MHHSPNVKDKQEPWGGYGQLQFSPVSDQVRHSRQEHVAQTERVVCDYASQHAPFGARPLSTLWRKTVDLEGGGQEGRRGITGSGVT